MKVDDIVDVVLQDREYYDSSGGGVTISGGEPLYQYNSLKSLLAKLKEKGISTALDTTGYASQDWFLDICKIVNIVLFDIKHMDDEIHRKLTGVGNELILNNFRELIKLGKEVYVRYPMIKGYNDDMDNIKEMCGLLKEAGINQLDVIPFHDIGESKYYSISYEPIHIEKHTDDEIRNRIKLIEKYGIKARII
jgi:pyruvate formate lyase activating enzyme